MGMAGLGATIAIIGFGPFLAYLLLRYQSVTLKKYQVCAHLCAHTSLCPHFCSHLWSCLCSHLQDMVMAHLAARVATKGHRDKKRAAKQQAEDAKAAKADDGILDPFNAADGGKASLTTAGGGGAAL